MSNRILELFSLQFNANIPTYFLAIALLFFMMYIKSDTGLGKKQMITIIFVCVELTLFSSAENATRLYFKELYELAIQNGFESSAAYVNSVGLNVNAYNALQNVVSVITHCLRIVLSIESYYLVEPNNDTRKRNILSIPGYIAMVLFIITPFTKLCFHYDASNFLFHKGPLHVAFYIVALFYIFHILIEVYKSYKNNWKLMNFLFLLLISAIVIAVLKASGTIVSDNDITNPIYLLTISIFYLLMESQALYEEMDLKEKNLTNSKLAAMTNQIRPHFIFNCISNIIELCDENSMARKALITFSRYLRININSLEQVNAVEFDKELEYIKNYVALEQMRYPDGFEMTYDIQVSNFLIPLISVEIYVENAIKHNVGEKDGVVHVELKTYEKDGNTIIEVNDDGVGFDTHTMQNTNYVGTNNAKYRLINIVNAQVYINSRVGEGTNVYIEIPKPTGDK